MYAAVFVDVNALYHAVSRKFDRSKVDYNKYMSTIYNQLNGYSFVRQTAYMLYYPPSSVEGFRKALERAMFTVEVKTANTIQTERGIVVKNKCWSVKMTLDVLKLLPKVDHFVFGINDGVYEDLFTFLKSRDKEVTLFSCGAPKSLRN
jgi:hypothetical protein